ncbi:hypothetical protein A7X67_01385 [Clostridium sp. W14A]|nr:hypothetical protein A7X67_01385 [Clostridium sp. W14A]
MIPPFQMPGSAGRRFFGERIFDSLLLFYPIFLGIATEVPRIGECKNYPEYYMYFYSIRQNE